MIAAAFTDQPFADGDEQDLVDTLRAIGALTLSLVAETNSRIIGHIAFSPAQKSNQNWFALGPVAVDPAFQNHGIGGQLIETGLTMLHAAGAQGCFLTGNPDYYQRFGFNLAPANAPDAESPDYYMLRMLNAAEPPEGPIQFHDAFYADHASQSDSQP